MNKRAYIYCVLAGLLAFFGLKAVAQDRYCRVRGAFLQDSIFTGKHFYYYLSAHHSAQTEVLLPDTFYVFGNFELIDRQLFPTKTLNGQSIDSVVYKLRSFDVEPKQYLSLPVWVIDNMDSMAVFGLSDSVALVSVLPDTNFAAAALPLKEESDFRHISSKFNYPYFVLIICIIFVVIITSNYYLGKPLNRWLTLIIMRRRQLAFKKAFERLKQEFYTQNRTDILEKIIFLWKKQMERIGDEPFSSYTSKEIYQLISDDNLLAVLQDFDRYIYGGVQIEANHSGMKVLEQIAQQYYKNKQDQIRGLVESEPIKSDN